MNRFFKFISTVLIIIVVLVAGAAFILPRFLDPNNYRDEIAELFYKESGLLLSINGPIGWSVFPWVGLSLNDISVNSPDNTPLGHLGNAEVSVKLMPLLSKRVEVQTARLQGLELSLVKDKNGKGNWGVSNSKTTSQTASDTPAKQKKSGAIEFNIAGVDITDLVFSYEDQTSGQKYRIDQAGLTTGAIRNQEPVDFNLQARISVPDLVLISSINGTLTFNLTEGIYDLDNLKIRAHPNMDNAEKLNIVGNFHLEPNPLQANGKLDVTQFNPAILLHQLGIQIPALADEKALTRLSFNSEFNTDGTRFNANKLKLQLDDFNIDGYFKIPNLDQQKMFFNFTGNDLNLDHYMPSDNITTQSTGTTEKPSSAPAVKEQPLIPEDMLRKLKLDGSMKLNSLTAANLRFEQPSIKIKAADGKQDVTIGAVFYQGKIDLNTKLDVRQKNTPKIKIIAGMNGINLESLATVIPELKPVHGIVNANLDVNTKGQLHSILTKNLNGNVKFNIDQGEFTNANFDKLVCEGVALIRKSDLRNTNWSDSTRFKNLSGNFIIRNGVATNDNLIAALSNLNLKGDGKIDLVQQSLDYHLGLNIRGSESPDSDPACQINENYVDVTWPVRCKGSLGTQKCGIDSERLGDIITDLLSKEAKAKIEEKLEEQLGESLDDNLKAPVKELLKGLFN